MQHTYTTVATLSPAGILDVTTEELEDWVTAALLPAPLTPDSTTLPVFDPVTVRITVERL
jgi:hypothetical protein